MKRVMRFLVPCLTLAFSTATAASQGSETKSRYSYISFPVSGDHTTAGKLTMPLVDNKRFPAVVIIHGSGGVDSRGPAYASKLNELGIATLEIDMWSARNMAGGLDRPKHVSETLPDAEAAFRYLVSRPDINSNSIGLMGFSWGGVVGMLTATSDAPKFKSIASLYPVCWGYNKVPGYEFTRVNVGELLIISGTADEYDNPADCKELIKILPNPDRQKVSEVSLVGATHGFDRSGSPEEFFDPYAFRGKGGEVSIQHDKAATERSLSEIGEFFNRTLNQDSS